jgi:putative transcriptional regulator
LGKNRLREFREKGALSQQLLAERLGVTRQTIISIESGRYVPSLELALRISREFKCRVEGLFGL